MCKPPAPHSPAGDPGETVPWGAGAPGSHGLFTLWIEDQTLHPRGGRQTKNGSQSGGGGPSWPLRQADTSLSITYTFSKKRGAANASCPLLSSLFSPGSGRGQDRLLTSLLPAAESGRLCSPFSGQSPGAADALTHQSYPTPSWLSGPLELNEGRAASAPRPGCRGRRMGGRC